ncbi:MAG: methionyl-tRNA formyltransferase [Bacteroidota bacterium]|nr:methionyl-tRNA formyltransferase [Bacteroidota bacterium]
MKIVFFGTPDFAVASLEAINQSNHEIVGVVTSVDKPAGRGKKLQSSSVKKYAEEHNLLLLQPENLKDESFISSLSQLEADLFVVVAFRMMPKIVWSMPKMGTFNLHASLLPQYRGAAPINWAIINGESYTGVTTFLIDDKIDTGNILMYEKTEINPIDNAGSLHDKLMLLGKDLVLKTIDNLQNNSLEPTKQITDGIELKLAPKLSKANTKIDWNESGNKIVNKIKGLSPYPSSWCKIQFAEKTLNFKLFDASLSDLKIPAGHMIIKGKNCYVGTNSNAIKLLEVQVEGKKRTSSIDFINGHKQFENITLL